MFARYVRRVVYRYDDLECSSSTQRLDNYKIFFDVSVWCDYVPQLLKIAALLFHSSAEIRERIAVEECLASNVALKIKT